MIIVNVIVLANLAGLVIGFILTSVAPSLAISVLTGIGIYAKNSLSFEKYEHVDTRNYKSERSRFFHVNKEGYKKEITMVVRLIFAAITISVFELIALALYFTLV